MKIKPKLLDVIALLENIPEKKLSSGEIGTIVEQLDDNVYEVEFSDKNGRTYEMAAIDIEKMLVLQFKEESILDEII